MYRLINILLLLGAFISTAQSQDIQLLTQKEGVSFRGLALLNEDCIWVSGSGGTVGKSLDGGKTWSWPSPQGYEKFDFRDIEVFSRKEALIVSAGSPAVILRTEDGGENWREVYRDERPAIFLDGLDFQGKEGFVIGDPIEGLFQLLQSKDSGKSWQDVSNFMYLMADTGEAVFAASGSSIQYLKKNLWVGTGGSYANLFRRNERMRRVDKYPCPIAQGSASKGIFSIDFWDNDNGVAVGGDYQNDKLTDSVVMLTKDGGKNWISGGIGNSGFKSAVRYLSPHIIIATGTSGTDISLDAGLHWKNISPESFNSIARKRGSPVVYLAGSKGNIAKVSIPE